jgi:hypothetical protein
MAQRLKLVFVVLFKILVNLKDGNSYKKFVCMEVGTVKQSVTCNMPFESHYLSFLIVRFLFGVS